MKTCLACGVAKSAADYSGTTNSCKACHSRTNARGRLTGDYTAQTVYPARHIDWHQEAACRGHDPNTWHPHAGEHKLEATAKTICAQCEVAEACLSWALSVDEPVGIYGGMTAKERERLTGRKPRLSRLDDARSFSATNRRRAS